jgi:hypothetical protein
LSREIDQDAGRISTNEPENPASMSDAKLAKAVKTTQISTEGIINRPLQMLGKEVPTKTSDALSKVECKFDAFKAEPSNMDHVDQKIEKRSIYKPSRK